MASSRHSQQVSGTALMITNASCAHLIDCQASHQHRGCGSPRHPADYLFVVQLPRAERAIYIGAGGILPVDVLQQEEYGIQCGEDGEEFERLLEQDRLTSDCTHRTTVGKRIGQGWAFITGFVSSPEVDPQLIG